MSNYKSSDFLEYLDTFKDSFFMSMERIERLIIAMQNDEEYIDSVNELFRIFHSLKAHAHYAGLKEIVKSLKSIEDVLDILRHKKPPVRREVVDWLLMIYDFMIDWKEDLEDGNYIKPIDSYSLNMVKVSAISTEKTKDILKKQTVLVIESSNTIGNQINHIISKNVKKLYIVSDVKKIFSYIEKIKPDILILNTSLTPKTLHAILVKSKKILKKKIPTILLKDTKLSSAYNEGIKKLSFDTFILKTELNKLLKKCEYLAKSYYEDKWLVMHNKELKDLIGQLKPLSNTVIKLQEQSSDPDSTVKDIAKTINSDPILTGNLLRLINSPFFSLRQEINNVQQLITLLGKERTCALALQSSVKESFEELDLSSYGIDEHTFFSNAKKRMEVMVSWFSKVSFQKLPILATTSLLGTIGQIIIAKEVKKTNRENEFKEIVRSVGSQVAEVEFFNTTTEDITADILAHWNLGEEIIDSIRFAFDIHNAKEEIKQLAIANYVVFNTVDSIDSNIDNDKIEEMASLLSEMNFDPEHYVKAVSKHTELEMF